MRNSNANLTINFAFLIIIIMFPFSKNLNNKINLVEISQRKDILKNKLSSLKASLVQDKFTSDKHLNTPFKSKSVESSVYSLIQEHSNSHSATVQSEVGKTNLETKSKVSDLIISKPFNSTVIPSNNFARFIKIFMIILAAMIFVLIGFKIISINSEKNKENLKENLMTNVLDNDEEKEEISIY